MDQAQTTHAESTTTTEASTAAPQLQNANFIAVIMMTWLAILNF